MKEPKIALEELLWTCECGQPMGADGIRANKKWELICSQCGPVAWVKFQTWPLETFQTINQEET